MSFPRYERYKDSGVEWLGKVPEHWELAKFRHKFMESPEKIDERVVGVMLSVSGYRGIEVKEYEDENQRRLEENLVGYRVVRPGQLVVNTMWLNYAGLGVSDFEGHVSPAYRAYWIDPNLNKRFVHHLMRSEIYVRGYTKYLTGVRPNSLQMSRDDLMVFPILVPPAAEESAIADFLDHETAKIDALIEEQRRLIALLKEKRQAVISQAVTKGLNPDAPMKNSGVEWLCEVPAHWGLKRLKQLATKITDGEHISPVLAEEGVPLLSAKDVRDWIVDFRVDKYVSVNDAKQFWKRCKPEDGDILVVSRGATVGRVGVVDGCIDFCLMGSVILCKPTDEYESDFLYYALNAKHSQTSLWFSSDSSAQQAIYIQDVADVPIPIPPFAERTEIAAFLKDEIAKLDTLAAEAQRATDMLQECRSALISAAVTGKIDVRNYSPRETPSHEEVYEPA